jgi:pimeloyl-ACP methyl ester carboxylesterase
MLKKIGLGIAGLLALAVAALAMFYAVDGQPLADADGFMNGPDYAATEEADGTLVFRPAQATGRGLLIMHGALIKPRAYAKTAAFFARRGYTVYIPSGPARLSINAIDAAAARLPEFAMDAWFFVGHSMGGFTSLSLIERHGIRPRAIGLWATSMPADFTGVDVPMLFLWGDRDGLLPEARFADTRSKLPSAVRYVTVEGGNHQDFAMYSHQFFDNPGELGWATQIELANELTAEFFARF